MRNTMWNAGVKFPTDSGIRRYFLIGGYKNIAREARRNFLELHPNAFKPYPYCVNLAVK